jgi:hypothetical protein
MTRFYKSLLIFFLVFAGASIAHAQSTKTIILKDGSKLKGQIVSLEDGVYKIQNSNLGNIQVREENILSISAEDFSQPTPAAPITGGGASAGFRNQVQEIQGSVMSDPALMEDISTLTQDPEFIKMLNDKELISDIYSYDPARIQSNPKLQQLMQNPKMRELIEKIQSRQ